MTAKSEARSVSEMPVVSPTLMAGTHQRRRRLWSASLFAGVVAMLMVAGGGVGFALEQPVRWTATADVLIVPVPTEAEEDGSAYFEVLSRGQVTSTAAEIMSDSRFLTAAANDLGTDPTDVASDVSVVPGTAVVTVSVTADDPAVAEVLADRLVSGSMSTVSELLSPFEVRRLGSADGSATRSGLSPGQLAAAIGLLSIVVGVAVQQAVQHIIAARRQVISQTT